MVNQRGNPHRPQILAKQRQSALRRKCFVRRRQFERQHCLQCPHRTHQMSDPQTSIAPVSRKNNGFFKPQIPLLRNSGMKFILPLYR
jgi:hypothetical protein